MAKFLELTVLIALITIPARAARAADPGFGLRRALIESAAFNLIYLFIMLFLVGRLAN